MARGQKSLGFYLAVTGVSLLVLGLVYFGPAFEPLLKRLPLPSEKAFKHGQVLKNQGGAGTAGLPVWWGQAPKSLEAADRTRSFFIDYHPYYSLEEARRDADAADARELLTKLSIERARTALRKRGPSGAYFKVFSDKWLDKVYFSEEAPAANAETWWAREHFKEGASGQERYVLGILVSANREALASWFRAELEKMAARDVEWASSEYGKRDYDFIRSGLRDGWILAPR